MPEHSPGAPAPQENHHHRLLQQMGSFVALLTDRQRKGHKAVSAAAASLVIGLSVGGETAMADTAPVSPDGAAPAAQNHYRSPEALPGKDIKVSEKSVATLKNSTVTIVKGLYSDRDRTKPFGRWEHICTGAKVLVKGKPFISTAAHCFSDRTGNVDGRLDSEDYKGNPSALDFGKIPQRMDVAITDYTQSAAEHGQLGSVSSLLISTRKDTALLKIKPHPASGRAKTRAYDKIPSLRFGTDTSKLTPGQEIGVVGLAAANENMPTTGKGTYLGRYQNADGSTFDMVGMSTAQRKNSCDPGTSGNRAVGDIYDQSGKLVESVMTGPLSRQFNVKSSGIRAVERSMKLKLQGEYIHICGYTVQSQQTENTMAAAVGNYPKPSELLTGSSTE